MTMHTNKPKVIFKDGSVGHVITKGEEVSLIYLVEEGREQLYPNRFFRPAEMKPRRKRGRIKSNGAA